MEDLLLFVRTTYLDLVEQIVNNNRNMNTMSLRNFNLDSCAKDPAFCLNGGTCAVTMTGARCRCTDRYEGDRFDRCSERFQGDECQECSPRFQGDECQQCSERFHGDSCQECLPGFQGDDCDTCADGYYGHSCGK